MPAAFAAASPIVLSSTTTQLHIKKAWLEKKDIKDYGNILTFANHVECNDRLSEFKKCRSTLTKNNAVCPSSLTKPS